MGWKNNLLHNKYLRLSFPSKMKQISLLCLALVVFQLVKGNAIDDFQIDTITLDEELTSNDPISTSTIPASGTIDAGSLSFLTSYKQEFKYECPFANTLNKIRSNHHWNDRKWGFGCLPAKGFFITDKCEWSAYVNKLDQPLDYRCPAGYLLTGMEGKYSGWHRDRQFSFKCCQTPPWCQPKDCTESGYVNKMDQNYDFTPPSGYQLTGVYSVHKNFYEDRIWKFRYCSFDSNACAAGYQQYMNNYPRQQIHKK